MSALDDVTALLSGLPEDERRDVLNELAKRFDREFYMAAWRWTHRHEIANALAARAAT